MEQDKIDELVADNERLRAALQLWTFAINGGGWPLVDAIAATSRALAAPTPDAVALYRAARELADASSAYFLFHEDRLAAPHGSRRTDHEWGVQLVHFQEEVQIKVRAYRDQLADKAGVSA